MSHHLLPDSLLHLAVVKHWLPFYLGFPLHAVLALVAGLLILVRPRFLNFIVAIYLILIGLLGILNLHW